MKYKYNHCKLDLRGLPQQVKKSILLECLDGLYSERVLLKSEALARLESGAHDWFIDYYSASHPRRSLNKFFELAPAHTIQIDGKTIELSEESYQELKKQLVDS